MLRRTYEEEIAPEALTLRTDEVTQTFAWSGFSGFVESDRQFVLLDRSAEPSVVLPKRGLADPSLVPACRRLLTEHLTAAPAGRACRPRRRLTAPAANGPHTAMSFGPEPGLYSWRAFTAETGGETR